MKRISSMSLALLPLAVAASAVFLVPGNSAQAFPPFKDKEGKPCDYCHLSPRGGKRNYRGLYYKAHALSFAMFDDSGEAKKAGVDVAPDPDPSVKPKSWTAPPAPAKVFATVYPGPGQKVFGESPDGVVIDGKPVGRGWKSLFDGKSLKGWVGEAGYWSVQGSAIVGDKKGETPHHHYLFSAEDYSDFEMHIDVRMTGYNSGVCTRIKPTSFDDAPGYQVDMGDGYWGCVWDERRRNKKIYDFPKADADQIVKKDDWNHYYIRHVGTKTTIFLNGVKTADGDDPEAFLSGPIGFQLCHGGNTVAGFKNIHIKALKKPTKGTAPTPPATVVP